jgi:hypothetical protein
VRLGCSFKRDFYARVQLGQKAKVIIEDGTAKLKNKEIISKMLEPGLK